MRPARGIAFAAAVLATAGCGGDGGSGGYLARAENGAAYLHWTREGDEATGALTLARLEPKDHGRYALDADEAPFTAVIDGSDVTLTFEHGLGLRTRWSGTIDGDTIVLSYQADDGTLQELRFERAEREAYNEAVAALQQAVDDAETAAGEAEATQAAIEQVDKAAKAAWSRMQMLQGYPAEFERLAGEATQALPGVREALARAEHALATTRTADSFNVCYEAESTAYEADSVDYEVDEIRYTLDGLNGSVSTMRDEIAALEAAVAELDAAASSVDYTPASAPAPADVEAAIDNARAAAADASKAVNSALAEAKRLAAQADERASEAKMVCDQRG